MRAADGVQQGSARAAPTAQDPAPEPGPARPGLRRALFLVVVLAALVVAGLVLYGSSGELLSAADDLTRVRPGWLVAAVLAELVCYVCLSAAQRVLLGSARSHMGLVPMTALSLAAQSVANCLPGGPAVGTVVTFRRLSRRGIAPSRCGWMLSVSSLLYISVLAVLALIGAQVSGGAAGGIPDLRPVAYGVVGVAVGLAVLARVLRRKQLFGRAALWVVHRADRLVARVRHRTEDHGRPAEQFLDQLRSQRPRPAQLVVAAAWILGCWLADIACLAAAFYALGSAPPWRGLLLSYCAAQLAALLPITPGGLGVVEGSLTVALVAFGGGEQDALAAVLLYRIVSFWGLIPTGGVAYLLLYAGERKSDTAPGGLFEVTHA